MVNFSSHERRVPSRFSWLIVLGAIWTSPNTALGLLIGTVGMLGGARIALRSGEYAVVFTHWPWGQGGALTLGNCILHTGPSLDTSCALYAPVAGCSPELTPRLADHERAHVFQYMVLGPLFLPVYLACGGISARNPFERAADRYALLARGWWPARNLERR